MVVAPVYGGSFQSQSLSTKYTPGSQHLPYDAGVAGQGTSGASEVLSSYSSRTTRMPPAQTILLGQGLKDSGKLMQMSSRIETPINILSKQFSWCLFCPPNTRKDGGILAGLVTETVKGSRVVFKVLSYELLVNVKGFKKWHVFFFHKGLILPSKLGYLTHHKGLFNPANGFVNFYIILAFFYFMHEIMFYRLT